MVRARRDCWKVSAVTTGVTALLVLDLAGTFAFALNGALTALRATRLDIVGVVTLETTALGGGTLRDFFLDSLPPPSPTGATLRWQPLAG